MASLPAPFNMKGTKMQKCEECHRQRVDASFIYPCSSGKICKICVKRRKRYIAAVKMAISLGQPEPVYTPLHSHQPRPPKTATSYPFDLASREAANLLNKAIAWHGQAYVAEKLGMTQASVSRMANWRQRVMPDMVRKIKYSYLAW
jgi:hypothetical protein